MLKELFNIRPKKRVHGVPLKESKAKAVSVQRFNDMIDYYTAELKSRIDEINHLKEENELLIRTSLKNASRADEFNLRSRKLEEELRVLKQEKESK